MFTLENAGALAALAAPFILAYLTEKAGRSELHPAHKGSPRESGQVLVEVCIDSVESAAAAEAGGCHRVELCGNLLEGGTTPSYGMIKQVRSQVKKAKLMVMIRPRGGDFVYSADELEVMKYDISMAKECGADGIVFGVLTADGDIDVPLCKEIIKLSRPLQVTFHRAIDMTRDIHQSLATLEHLGVDRVLTSGGEKSVLEGSDIISEMVNSVNANSWNIRVLIGGGVTEKNFQRVLRLTGAPEVHVSGRVSHPSPMKYRNTGVSMGGEFRPPEFTISIVSQTRISAYLNLTRGLR